MKKMKMLFLYFIVSLMNMLVCYLALHSQTPQIKWWFDTKDASAGQTAAGDIDGDGKLELVFGCYRNDSCIYALNAEDGSLLWKYNTHLPNFEGCNDDAPIIFDVDGDGKNEVIVPSSCNPTVFCFNGEDGSIKWQTDIRGSDSPPSIADIDGDGSYEILFGEFGGFVICLDAKSGNVKWEIAVDTNSWIQTSPTIVDLNGDGNLDFVVASWVLDSINQNRFYAYRGSDHSLLWTHNIDDVIYHGTAVADLDHDGKPELVVGDYSGRVNAFNGEDGSLAWTFFDSSAYFIGGPVSIGDVDGDGNCECVLSGYDIIYALHNDGSLMWKYNIADYSGSFRGVVLADVDNDNLPDVIFGTSSGKVMALKGTNGDSLWSIDLSSHYGKILPMADAPIIADFNGDGLLDLFIVGGWSDYPNFQNNYGRAYAISIGEGNGPDWLMFQHDIKRTCSLCEFPTDIRNNKEITEKKLLNIYPNPSNAIFNIEINTENISNQSIYILDIFGRIIKKLTNIERNNKPFIWDGTDSNGFTTDKGIYFIRYYSNNKIYNEKIIKY